MTSLTLSCARISATRLLPLSFISRISTDHSQVTRSGGQPQ
jgi:hypothetical protein